MAWHLWGLPDPDSGLKADLDWLIEDPRRYRYAPRPAASRPCAIVLTARAVRRTNEGKNFTLRCACMAEGAPITKPFAWDWIAHVRDLTEAREVWHASGHYRTPATS